MSDWHCCLPGHAWGHDGFCVRCGAYEPSRKREDMLSPQDEIARLRGIIKEAADAIDDEDYEAALILLRAGRPVLTA